MPEQDGLQTIINIRKSDKHVPIIAMSSGGSIQELDYLKHSIKLGATHAVPKPLTHDVVRELITLSVCNHAAIHTACEMKS